MATKKKPTYEMIRLDREDPLVWITFIRERQLNAMNQQLHAELLAALDVLQDDPKAKVIAIRGAGRAFSSGNDIKGTFDKDVRRDITTDRTMIAKNIAFQAVSAGHSVLFLTAADLITDLSSL